jgi:hypothetical protein
VAECEICRSPLSQVETDWTRPGRECSRCGEFRFDAISGGLRSDTPWFSDRENDEMVRLSGWIREQNVAGNVPTLTDADVTRVIAIPRPDLRTRGMFALREIAKMDGALVGRYLANRQIVGNKSFWESATRLTLKSFRCCCSYWNTKSSFCLGSILKG